MRIDEINNNHLIADEGKVLRRISDNWVAGTEIYLGYTYYMSGEQLSEPLWELPEHYEEIDEAILDEVTDEAFDVPAEPALLSLFPDEAEPVSELETLPGRPTLADLLGRALTEIEGLKKEVGELKKGSTP